MEKSQNLSQSFPQHFTNDNASTIDKNSLKPAYNKTLETSPSVFISQESNINMLDTHNNIFIKEVRIDTQERDELFALEQVEEGLNVRYLIYAYLGLFLFLLVCMPKVWLSSAIYYTSRDINKLQTQRDLLKEENKRLQSEREKLRYQYLKLNSTSQRIY